MWSRRSEWVRVVEQLVFRAAPGPSQLPELSTTPLQLWAAPGKVALRGVVIYEVSFDPLTAAGGATQLRVGLNGGTNIDRLFGVASFGQINAGQVLGWGVRGAQAPGGSNGPNPNGDGGVVLVPQGEQNGFDPADNTRDGIYAALDAGTATGGIFIEFEYRRLAG